MVSKALIVASYHSKIDELVKLGVDVDLIIPIKWGKMPPEPMDAKNYRIHKLKCILSGYNHFHFYLGLKKVIDDVKPDIFHIDEEPHSLVTYQAMRSVQGTAIKKLFFTWQNIYKRYPFPFSYIERYNYNASDIAIAGNEEAKEVLIRKGYKKEILVIPQFGTDVRTFKRLDVTILKRKLVPDSRLFVIGYIGRLVKEKGLLNLLYAVHSLKEKVFLVLVGSGPYLNTINKVIDDLNIRDRVKKIGAVPSLEVVKYMNCFDCLVLPSLTTKRWKEQFGRVLAEAMACEVPVIGSTSGEIPNVIGDAGLVFEEGNTSDLKSKIQMLMENSTLRRRLSKAGRRRVVEKFSNEQIAKATLEAYESLLRKS